MQRQDVKSSNIKSVGYDERIKILEIEFKGGGLYEYYAVQKDTYEHLMKAGSIGSHFHKHVKNCHDWKKIESVESPQAQIERLTNFITKEVEGIPNQNEGTVDFAIRIITELQQEKLKELEKDG